MTSQDFRRHLCLSPESPGGSTYKVSTSPNYQYNSSLSTNPESHRLKGTNRVVPKRHKIKPWII